jgi:hypothetical protein
MTSSIDFLLQSQNADGGWGYRTNGMSYVEPTAAVLMALTDLPARAQGRDFLLSLQKADGGWGIAAVDVESGWMTAWAVRALVDFVDAHARVEQGAQWLIATHGLQITDPTERQIVAKLNRFDPALVGWPWQPGDGSWVHPTALAIIALIAAGYQNHARVLEGTRYLFDRAVEIGGWNIGNPVMLDKAIPATIQDTAVALLALQAAGAAPSDARVNAALKFMVDSIARIRTPAELAWSIFALRHWNVQVGDASARLAALQSADGSWQGNPFITSIAILASKE